MKRYGLIGKSLSHSFSRKFFTEKFRKENLGDHVYELYELDDISGVKELLARSDIHGLNVTIPYKTAIIPFLSGLDPRAERIGAVNVVAFRSGGPVGFNSDYHGFRTSLEAWMGSSLKSVQALILGTGGASRAVRVALEDIGVPFRFVSRTPDADQLSYNQLDADIIREHHLIINTTPLGMAPDAGTFPALPYRAMGPNHYLYDLVYNPETTLFMRKGQEAGARTMNGLEMLYLQAEASWSIWNK